MNVKQCKKGYLQTTGTGLLCVLLAITAGMQAYAINLQNTTPPPPPPNETAQFILQDNNLDIKYNGQVIFKGTIENEDGAIRCNEIKEKNAEAVNHAFMMTSSTNKTFKITGYIYASSQAFPCEADRKQETNNDVIRHSVGLSNSLLNRAVYDRQYDWVLSVDYFAEVNIKPENKNDRANTFKLTAEGSEIILRFRPRFYQKHRGLKYYQPWTYNVWAKPVVGWCSWFAYFKDIDEEKIKNAADVIAEKLKPYGVEYIQIDDGYQQDPVAFPETWLKANEKFPSGMDNLAKYITDKGLKPGIWTYCSFMQKDAAFANKELFVLNEKQEPGYGRWVGYSIDGSNPEALEKIVRPVYRGFKNMGYNYFKVDGLRHLRYEGYNSYPEHFKKKTIDRTEAYRNIVKAVREEIGKENFMLGCWGIRPELIGIIDGCRIGGDGYGAESLAQYNSFNNVIWRNDPDHIELNETQAYLSCMTTSMTGSLFMVTDKPQMYSTERIEPAIRSVPVLFTLPGQLYDVDPSRSMYLDRADSEMSGSGTRVFDASRSSPYELFVLEINKPYENWILLGRTGEKYAEITFKELGLDEKKEYAIFDFWAKTFKGIYKQKITFEKIDARFNCQLYCIREKQDHPQVLATNRHISCGALELSEVRWENNALSGKAKLAGGYDEYIIYIREPAGFKFKKIAVKNTKLLNIEKNIDVRQIKLQSDQPGEIEWMATYQPE